MNCTFGALKPLAVSLPLLLTTCYLILCLRTENKPLRRVLPAIIHYSLFNIHYSLNEKAPEGAFLHHCPKPAAQDITGVCDDGKGFFVHLFDIAFQEDRLSPIQHGNNHLVIILREGTRTVADRCAAVQGLVDISTYFLVFGSNDNKAFAEVDTLDDVIHHKGFGHQTQDRKHTGFDIKNKGGGNGQNRI